MIDSESGPSLRTLLSDISSDARLLVAQTAMLARLEIKGAVSQLMWSSIGVVASAVIAIAGTAVLISAIVLILIALGIPAWAAALLTGVVLTGGGAVGAGIFVGRIRHTDLSLKETRESVRETLTWAKLQTSNQPPKHP